MYYGFSYKMADNEPAKYFVWKSLPYGYTRAPYITKELMRPLIAKWRKLGGRVVVFYDDGMSVHKHKNTLTAIAVQMQCDLLNAGLIPGIEKCTWQPADSIDWNGLHFDFQKHELSILPKRISKTKTLIENLLSKFLDFTYREVAKMVGTINSMASVFEGKTQIFTRNLQTFVNIRHANNSKWDEPVNAEFSGLYTSMYKELLYWKSNINHQNSRPFVQLPKWIGWTDASDYACGGMIVALKHVRNSIPITADNLLLNHQNAYINLLKRTRSLTGNWPWHGVSHTVRGDYDLDMDNVDETVICFKSFTPYESAKDSNERELIGIELIVKCMTEKLERTVITLHTDNMNAAVICTKGSTKPRLNKYAVAIAKLAQSKSVKINVIWIPRILNYVADYISVLMDFMDYSIKQCHFDSICSGFGIRLDIDLFASDYNKKCEKFFSLTYSPGTVGVDAFNYDWSQYGIGWVFVPPQDDTKSHSTCYGIGIRCACYYTAMET
jgi:hypothetical protein